MILHNFKHRNENETAANDNGSQNDKFIAKGATQLYASFDIVIGSRSDAPAVGVVDRILFTTSPTWMA